MARSRELRITFSGDARDLNRALDGVQKRTGAVEKQMSGFSKRAGAGLAAVGGIAAGAMTAGLAKATQAASDVQESLSKNQVLFGGYAKDVEAFSRTTAQSFGISRQAALEATGTFGNLFTALDIAPKAAADMSVGLTKLAADLASFNNASPEEALEAIRSGLVGETEPLRRFGVNLNDAALRAEALSQGLIKTTKDALTPQQKALAVNALLFKQTSSAQGDFARTSGGLANQQRILRAQLSDVGVQAGTVLIPILLKVTSALTGMARWVQNNTTQARNLAIVAGVLVTAVGGMMIAARVATAFTVLRGAVLAVNAAMRANPIGLVVTALALLATGLVVAYKRSETFRSIVQGTFTAMRDVAVTTISLVLGLFDRLLGAYQAVASAAGKLPGPLGAPFRAAARAIGDARENVQELQRSINGLKGKTVAVRVAYKIVDAKGNNVGDRPGQDFGAGKPLTALEKAITSDAQDAASKAARRRAVQFPSAPGALGGRGASGVDAFNPIASRYGLTLTSGFRPGDPGFHGVNRARDYSNGFGPTPQMMAFAKYMAANFGSKLRELIYTPLGFSIKNGQRTAPFAQAAHYNHVHVAYRDGGKVGPTVGGPRVFVAGEGRKDEWVISQEGDRRKNTQWALEALQAVSGGSVHMHAKGKRPSRPRARDAIFDALDGKSPFDIAAAEALVRAQVAQAQQVAAVEAQRAAAEAAAEAQRAAAAAAADQAAAEEEARREREAAEAEAQRRHDELVRAQEEAAEAARALAAIQAEMVAGQQRILAVATSQPNVMVQALLDTISGGIGGRVGLGVQTPGFAGGGVRY